MFPLLKVYSVGIATPLLISHNYSHHWCMCVNSEDGVSVNVGIYPWSSLVAPDPNPVMLDRLKQGILSHIITHPGVTMVCN